jgi:hypothetical protein
VSGRAEILVSKVAKRKDTKQKIGEKAKSHPSEEDRWREIERSRELGSLQGESPNIGSSES